jgi:hypothetical protein
MRERSARYTGMPCRFSPAAPTATSTPTTSSCCAAALGVGGFRRLTSGPSEGDWQWDCSLGSGNFVRSGRAPGPDECKQHIAHAFRAMLMRADLRERADAKPGPRRRVLLDTAAVSYGPPPTYDREQDRRLGPMRRNELSRAVRSGELTVGVINRSTHGREQWSWMLTGLDRPDDEDFTWHGEADTEAEAFEAFERCWSYWLAWAGCSKSARCNAA